MRGPTKIYRRACWNELDGLIHAPGWDTLDEVKANMLGWATRTLQGINAIHHRPTGAAYGTWNEQVKGGVCKLYRRLSPVVHGPEMPATHGGETLFRRRLWTLFGIC